MLGESKPCPQCGGAMSLRLGVYECLSCGHEVEPPPPEAGAEGPRHGPGLRKEAWHRPAGGQPGQPPPPPTAGTVFTPGVAPASGVYGGYESVAAKSKYPTLETEKRIVFGFEAGCGGIEVLLMLVGAIAVGGGEAVGSAIGSLIGLAIGLYILWYVLFDAQLWLKQVCCGVQGCAFVGAIFVLLFASSPAVLNVLNVSAFDHGLYMIVLWVMVLPQMAWNAWLMFIFWRDIQVLQGR